MTMTTSTHVTHRQRGLLFVITGASGVGKGTLRTRLLESISMVYSISWTTREARVGEYDGLDYHFRTREAFLHEIEEGAGFLEYAEFVGNLYGTPRGPVEQALKRGENVLLEIEAQGAMQIKKAIPNAILIFIMPPSLKELHSRLTGRATETPDKIAKRLERARDEIRMTHSFDYVVVNDDIERAANDLKSIVVAENLRSGHWKSEELEAVLAVC